MKNTIIRLLIAVLLIVSPSLTYKAQAQDPIVEAVKAAVKRVIKAVDLQVQRWQNQVLDLQNIQREAENLLSKLKLQDIADWTNKQKQLYSDYFDELWRVKTVITYYNRLAQIYNMQKQIVTEYGIAYSIISQDNHFTPAEQDRIHTIYTNLLTESLSGIDDVIGMMKSFTVQMSDADRLVIINKTADALEEHLSDLREFNQDNKLLSLQRSKNQEEIDFIKKLYNF
ncbi:hypothetical protein SAMN05421788_110181 [Filimonas lacunae]|uniref:Conjugal transfer protein TraI n=1 Tax=Filimonas lacunae TaxID=477680 RepID=A0A173MA85_9BACT|nr:hypothetical protein [Filimonas lacunae]BAV04446.1 conjugative transposon protein TraI [Filimonas lacunae]SIT31462.1 hypothetical protein SAMN05421788_110181 [Filimonas lacunae]